MDCYFSRGSTGPRSASDGSGQTAQRTGNAIGAVGPGPADHVEPPADARGISQVVVQPHDEDRSQRGICEVDCSGFVSTVLAAVSPEHVKVIPLAKAGRKHPLAEDFYAAFAAGGQNRIPGWQTVSQLSDAGRATCWPGGKRNVRRAKTRARDAHRRHAGARAARQMATAYYRLDQLTPRPRYTARRHDGAGPSVIWLDVDASGRILGYHWKSANGKLNEHPVAIGRAV